MSSFSGSDGHEKKLQTAKEKKELADKAFQASDLQTALRYYHEALLYLKGLDSNTTDVVAGNTGDQSAEVSPEKKEISTIIEKVYSNMCACQIKQGRWQRAIETADKVLAKNEGNVKAKFRKGKALGELGFFEKSTAILEDLLKANEQGPDAPAIKAELQKFKVMEKEVTKKADTKIRGFLNKDKALLAKEEKPAKEPEPAVAS
jgi:FK506-binding protein 8